MTKNEFLSRLEAELEARRVPEPEDILGEYRRHFEYKLADGYSEEEIAARLGAPEELAAQFEPEREAPHPSRAGSAARSALTWTGLVFADMFVLSFFMLFASWVAVVACAALASGLVSLCLLIPFDMQPYVNLPEIPTGAVQYMRWLWQRLLCSPAWAAAILRVCLPSSGEPTSVSTAMRLPRRPAGLSCPPSPLSPSLCQRGAGGCAGYCLYRSSPSCSLPRRRM